jgi:RimJ/RimL family protein N-acetyltransferase
MHVSTTPRRFLGLHATMVHADDVVVPAPCTLRFVTWRPMSLAIETERLTLRLRDERDAAWYRELIGERGEDTPTLEEATARLARFRDLTIESGIGSLAICRRAEGDVIGYCALIVGRCSLDEPEIAYELLRRFHGHGYATEAARALVEAAAATGRHRLWSTVRPWNAASLRVLEKIGFRRDHTTTDDLGDVVWLVRDLEVGRPGEPPGS